ITPCFNSEKYISDTIESVLSQTLTDFEMLVIDDGSSDTSVEIIKSYSERDSRVRLLRLEKNQGPGAARNLGISEARGRFIAFLDSDDLWHSEKLEKQIRFMISNGYEFTYTRYQRLDMSGRLRDAASNFPSEVCYEDLLKFNPIGCLTAVYDSEALGKVLMPLIRKRQDYALWLKLLRLGARAYGLDESLAIYRLRPGSVSGSKWHLVKYNWHVLRTLERLNPAKALLFLSIYAFKKWSNKI
ncbi:MAG: glycosyltransferase family 2 protein, partial [Bdellovibrionota bacterium]